jgi:hypothetical protein
MGKAKTKPKTVKKPQKTPAEEPVEQPVEKGAAKPAGPAAATGAVVRIRMYRHGLGDCFLIRFPGAGGKSVNIMIDCGLVLGARPIEGQELPKERLVKCVQNVIDETGNHLDLLVVTHEHWDHVGGFTDARKLFEKLQIDRLWMAWTEDPKDETATEIRNQRRQAMKALGAAFGMRGPGAAMSPLESLQGFFGALGAKDSQQTKDAFDFIKGQVAEKNKEYLKPGQKMALPGVDGVSAYVLGPPTDLKMLKKSKPSQKRDEIYMTPDVTRVAGEFLGMADQDGLVDSLSAPFDSSIGLSPEAAAVHPFFREHYGFVANDELAWRRIDNDWLALADQLALQLDSNTNNTSLVLAFELPNKKVLLFPGDAQIGNWMSWHTAKWEGEETTATDLLKRVALYKIGHHGSENATLSEQGMDLMPDNLAAMLPCNEVQAHAKRWNDMPYDKMLEALDKKHGKLMRLDTATPETVPPGTIVEDLFLEYSVPLN